ncbi:uncharacterized protein LOC125423438 [Ziziphus jujuba]|uniref:Uncharacterized protein LOC125423438 n=1 Tax=Ziziphus jujuba TaxID=326968 RepID=A0ABM3IQV8_ZIZJJ|nr:uncharacterized protein LOC125423438 [Ziziphus jujuba]
MVMNLWDAEIVNRTILAPVQEQQNLSQAHQLIMVQAKIKVQRRSANKKQQSLSRAHQSIMVQAKIKMQRRSANKKQQSLSRAHQSIIVQAKITVQRRSASKKQQSLSRAHQSIMVQASIKVERRSANKKQQSLSWAHESIMVQTNKKQLMSLANQREGFQAKITRQWRSAKKIKLLLSLTNQSEEGLGMIIAAEIKMHRRRAIERQILESKMELMISEAPRHKQSTFKASITLPAPALSQRTVSLGTENRKKVTSYLYLQLYMYYGMVLDGFIDLKHVYSGSHISTMNWNLIGHSRRSDIAYADHEHGPHMLVSISFDPRCDSLSPQSSMHFAAFCAPLLTRSCCSRLPPSFSPVCLFLPLQVLGVFSFLNPMLLLIMMTY